MTTSCRTHFQLPVFVLALVAFAVAAIPSGAQLGPVGTQFWNQDSPGAGTTRQTDAAMGGALAAGDFDCDGFDDLAIGMPGDTVGGNAGAGDVLVLYSSGDGPGTAEHDLLSQDTPGVLDAAEDGDRFGAALAAGDFDGDGCADLAIGAPGESIEAPAVVSEAGAVNVLYGGVLGLGVDGDDFFTQDSSGMPGVAQADDRFGSVLLAADLDLDGPSELVIGVPDEDLEGTETVTDAGAVHVLLGIQNGGLSAAASVLLVPGDAILNYIPADFERCGAALAAGDFFLGGSLELAIGVPGREGDADGELAAGMVVIVSNVEQNVDPITSYSQAGDVPGAPEAFDEFGAALAAGDFDGDGDDELAVGCPGEDLEAIPAEAAGAVIVLEFFFGNHTLWTQDDLPPEHADPLDFFGASLASGDWNGDGVDDLAIGVPGETLGGLAESGVVHTVLGSAGFGLVSDGRQLWLQTIDPSEDGDRFGTVLAAGHFSGHSGQDLAIGVPGEDLAGTGDTGGVNVLFSIALFLNGFETGLTPWSETVQ